MPPSASFAEILDRALADFGLALPQACRDGLVRHFALVLEANQRLNLTAIVDPVEAAAKHYCDSLAAVRLFDAWAPAGRAADVGSGAGFPGIPLALARPDWHWTLLDSKRKKFEFLREAVTALGLANAEAVLARSEELARRPPFRDGFDLCVGRAIAPLGTVAEILLPLVRPAGHALAMKGPTGPLGIEALDALGRLGCGEPSLSDYELPGGLGRRTLILLPKTDPTPEGFPRRPGQAAKRPLF